MRWWHCSWIVVGIVIWSSTIVSGVADDTPVYPFPARQTLAAAVHAFNVEAQADSIGKLETPLTIEEVKAAILTGLPEKHAAGYETLQAIARTGMLPPDAELKFVTSWKTANTTIVGWRIDLQLVTAPNSIQSHRVRTRLIKCQSPKLEAEPAQEPGAELRATTKPFADERATSLVSKRIDYQRPLVVRFPDGTATIEFSNPNNRQVDYSYRFESKDGKHSNTGKDVAVEWDRYSDPAFRPGLAAIQVGSHQLAWKWADDDSGYVRYDPQQVVVRLPDEE